MLKFAPEGYPFIAIFFVLTAIAVFAFGPRWALAPLALTLFMLYFFRDPERIVPVGPGFLSPADGKVIAVREVDEDEFLKGPATMISIFMSPLNVHVNRVPCDGTVREVRYMPGRHMKAYKDEAPRYNERTSMVLECADGGESILVRQVAGAVARRTVNRKRPGDVLRRGERFGIIKFSSRLDIFLPPGVDVRVGLNEMVRAGETVLALRGGGK